ncbi:ABC transporter substrate-binding protein [Tengunoibacter tsumagoiensis]|uniref:ABC transporter substrate-binding protein n=1 Tax=Tengunoibacter tsumagoiensis TaxID=2014871 RepID=A0A401ZZ06_9CHLR|nr:ABC transporter substrate-binding protein [Tengunoibacter tsumagoiensis]GCE12071.1 hypothetical protein KTT_19300 [Tengunoibacter tsumagoiensis]
MSEDTKLESSTVFSEILARPALTRRQMLRTMAATSAVVAGGAVLAACGGTSGAANVTLKVGTWPFAPLPSTITAADKKTPRKKVIADVLQTWLDNHKNVTLKFTGIDVSTDQALTAAILGNTAPAIYGGFADASLQAAALTQGLVADVTDVYKSKKVDDLIAPYAKDLWHSIANLGGKYTSFPGDLLSGGSGFFYRRDVFRANDIPEPTKGWTWEDVKVIAAKLKDINKGVTAIGGPSYLCGYLMNSDLLDAGGPVQGGGGLIGSVPDPGTGSNWHWKIDVTKWTSAWEDRIGLFRSMINDKTVFVDPSYWEGSVVGQFVSGQYLMVPAFSFFYSLGGFGPAKFSDLQKNYPDKSLDDLIGYAPYPHGANGAWSSSIQPGMGQVSFDPHLKSDGLDAITDLYLYMFFGQGYVDVRANTYKVTKDPKDAYDYIAPTNTYFKNPDVPANVTVEAAWGENFVQTYLNVAKQPIIPAYGMYFPPDGKTGPSKDTHADFLSRLSTTNDPIPDILKKFEDTYNQQASSLPSDLSSDDFKAGARKYYAALDKFWKENSTSFYVGVWQEYYHNDVLPRIS